jgi:diphthamide biosynthesis methyltransferase
MARRRRKIYEPRRYMTVGQCAQQMLEIEQIKREESEGMDSIYGEESLAIGAARVGGKTEKFVGGTSSELEVSRLKFREDTIWVVLRAYSVQFSMAVCSVALKDVLSCGRIVLVQESMAKTH